MFEISTAAAGVATERSSNTGKLDEISGEPLNFCANST